MPQCSKRSPNKPLHSKQQAKRRGLLDLKGRTFGHLKVVGKVPTPSHMKQRWNCQCVCGKLLTVRHDYLIHTNNPKTHCGCQNKGLPTLEKATYSCWQAMMLRCTYDKHVSFHQYGGRGIGVCAEWQTFEGFFASMGRRPSRRHSLDRLDAKKGYFPGNVRWATSKEQGRNKRTTVRLAHPYTGIVMSAAAIAESLGISYMQFRNRMIKEGKWPRTSPSEQ